MSNFNNFIWYDFFVEETEYEFNKCMWKQIWIILTVKQPASFRLISLTSFFLISFYFILFYSVFIHHFLSDIIFLLSIFESYFFCLFDLTSSFSTSSLIIKYSHLLLRRCSWCLRLTMFWNVSKNITCTYKYVTIYDTTFNICYLLFVVQHYVFHILLQSQLLRICYIFRFNFLWPNNAVTWYNIIHYSTVQFNIV